MFIQNIASSTPGGGSTLIASLPEYFPHTVMVAGATKSTRAISARMKGLGPDFAHYFAGIPIGQASPFYGQRKGFPDFVFETWSGFNKSTKFSYGDRTAVAFSLGERLRGEFVKSDDPILTDASGIISMVEELQRNNPQNNYTVPFISFHESLL